MSNNDQQAFPRDALLGSLFPYREPLPPQSAVDAERAKLDAEAAAKVAAEQQAKADADAVDAWKAYEQASAFTRAALRTRFGSAVIERGRQLSQAVSK